MLKKLFAAVLGTASVLSLNLPVYADDTIYPLPVQNYLNQLARDSDWRREAGTGKHDHFIAEASTEELVEISDKVCQNFLLGQTFLLLKPIIRTDVLLLFTSDVLDRLGTDGINRFTDVAIKSAVDNRCPQYSIRLPLLDYILPGN